MIFVFPFIFAKLSKGTSNTNLSEQIKSMSTKNRAKRKRKEVNYAQSDSDEDYQQDGEETSSSSSSTKSSKKAETKSPAEFFAANQNIAGFDNPGKALYTTVREFVENSLDAAETMGRLPCVQVTVEEIGRSGLDALRGVAARPSKKKRAKTEDTVVPTIIVPIEDTNVDSTKPTNNSKDTSSSSSASTTNKVSKPTKTKTTKTKSKSKKKVSRDNVSVFKITCKDNGMGMPHAEVPDMLGRVLSGSNYNLRQTRGKFGLGSKMALIWAKKSTGMPIEVKTSYCKTLNDVGPKITYCKLDIDIRRNEPKIIKHTSTANDNAGREKLGLNESEVNQPWLGTEISVIIEGNWSSHGKYIKKYFSSLAVITPYADLSFQYIDTSQKEKKRNPLSMIFQRRSDKIPPIPAEVKHHPESVNNIIVQQLLDRVNGNMTVMKFLRTEFQCITGPMSKKLVEKLGMDSKVAKCNELDDRDIDGLTQALKNEKFPDPSGKCLSPAGQYNLRLGIMKEFGLETKYVSTAEMTKAGAFEGHPFTVEVGLSFGGEHCKEGITVHRFANRIPLLFEGGSDVATKVATKDIKWNNYKLKSKADKIGVYVSICSTKIPFKGTGKEFISAQNSIYRKAIKSCIFKCANQLKSQIARDRAAGEDIKRRKNIQRFIPSVCKFIGNVLEHMAERETNAKKKDGKKSTRGSHTGMFQIEK